MSASEFPHFNPAFQLTYEQALRVGREQVHTHQRTALLTLCQQQNPLLQQEDLAPLYQDAPGSPEPQLLQQLLAVLGYPAQVVGFDLSRIPGRTRYLFFLDREADWRRCQEVLAQCTSENA